MLMQCDVVVVGAGPGGLAAACWFARSGADVLLVDKAYPPRNKPCGDGLTPHAVRLLSSLGLSDFVAERGWAYKGARVTTPDGRSLSFKFNDADGCSEFGFVIPRRDLDYALYQQAIQTGVRVLPGFVSRLPCHRNGQLVGILGYYEQRTVTIEARLVVVATGANRSLVRALGLAANESPGGLALRAYVSGLRELDDYLEVYLDRELLPGYSWVFPIGNGKANVGAGIKLIGTSAAEASRRLRGAFNCLLNSSRLAGGVLTGRLEGSSLQTDFPAVQTYTSGALVVGEAAGLVDPLTGEGIALALESGQLAAQVGIEALCADDVSATRLRRYDDLLRQKHTSYFDNARELIARLAHPQVLDALVRYSPMDERIRQGLATAIINRRPRDGMVLLSQAFHDHDGSPLVSAIFTLNAYQPILDRCRAYMLTQVRLDTPSPYLVDLIGRGKMLRALLVFLGCCAAGGDPMQVLAGAAGIELVHAASLIHDDIMDGATSRRGLPVLHTTLGLARAIVCGDYLIAKAFRLLAECRTANPATQVVEAFIIGAESGIRTCAGQYQDVGAWTEETLTEETYLQQILGKTTAAIAGALTAGAALAGGDQNLIATLSRYGECVGQAFQVWDDVLDFSSLDACDMDRRPTLPLVHAFQHGNARGKDLVRRFLDRQSMTKDEIFQLLEMANSLAYARAMANALAEQAAQLAESVPRVRGELQAFAHYVVLRNN